MSSKATAAKQREIQQQVEKADKKERSKPSGAMQAGARDYPAPPFPKAHQAKPGSEADLPLAPMYDAPFYKGSEKLKNKVALITGGDSGIGRSVAILFAREGADVAIVHLDEDKDAADTKAAVEREGHKCLVIKGDVKDPKFCRDAVAKTAKKFSRLDILVNNGAQAPFLRFGGCIAEAGGAARPRGIFDLLCRVRHNAERF
ncbi:short chain dehydrogenase (plasmid) [Rhizobium favelukesii]|uniref:Short chain dehydrogenase n=1 Tax=Rhizobium favelukesii TaxID=348824 RepID=W6RMM3_9HYPH|nr:short chain dehydrogenase [Rhizobium favelukesii]